MKGPAVVWDRNKWTIIYIAGAVTVELVLTILRLIGRIG